MPVKLSDLRARTRALELEIDGEVLNVVYRPGAITPELVDQLNSGKDEDVYAFFVTAIASWDLTDDEDQPIAIDASVLKTVGLGDLILLARVLMASIQPGEAKGGAFGAGSRRKAS